VAQRFTITEKWDDDWFLELTPAQKLFWLYICDNCNSVGIWNVSLKLASVRIGLEITQSDLEFLSQESRIIKISKDKVWVSKFVTTQYKKLSQKNPAHRSMMKTIIKAVEGLPLSGDSLELLETFKRLSVDPQPTHGRESVDSHGKGNGNGKVNNKKKVEEFSQILSNTEAFDVSLKSANEFLKIEEFFNSQNVFGDRLPPELSRSKTKFLSTLVHVYDRNLDDFKHHLTAIINEGLADDKKGPARAEYVLTRIKNKALELHNAT
jgi:hypothetical protein